MLGNRYVAAAVVIALLLVAAYNVRFFITRDKSNGAQDSRPAAAVAKTSAPEADIKPTAIRKDEAADTKGQWKRDPFSLKAKPANSDVQVDQNLKLTGIILGEKSGYAMINGKVYGLNDRIGSSVIREIKQHSIVIQTDGIKQEITFDDYKVVKEKKK